MTVAAAHLDWAGHFAFSQGKQARVVEGALESLRQFARYCATCAVEGTGHYVRPLPQDQRFEGADWQSWPFNEIH